jgi:hypothetical protein
MPLVLADRRSRDNRYAVILTVQNTFKLRRTVPEVSRDVISIIPAKLQILPQGRLTVQIKAILSINYSEV